MDGAICNAMMWTDSRMAGYDHDPETGLEHSWFRYYNPKLGRFMTADPLSGDVADPQSLNLFSYVENDPVNWVDPLGLCGDALSDIVDASCRGPFLTASMGGGGAGGAAGTGSWVLTCTSSSLGKGETCSWGWVPNSPIDTGWYRNFFREFFKFSGDKNGKQLCTAVFLKSAANTLNPFTVGLSSVTEPGAYLVGVAKFNNALKYAASQPNYLGGRGLIYPMKSSVFRTKLASAKNASGAGALVALDIALAKGLVDEYRAIRAGECSAGW
jgi:RHS repeat-associated protein